MKRFLLIIVIALSAAVTSRAQLCMERGDFYLEGGIDLRTHYNWRGYSQSLGSIQPEVTIGYGNVYFSVWASTGMVDEGKGYFDNKRLATEVDLVLGAELGAGFEVYLTDYWFDRLYWAEEGESGFDTYNYFGKYSDNHTLEATLYYSFEDWLDVPLSLSWSTMLYGDDKMMLEDGSMKQAYSSYVEAAYCQELPWDTEIYGAVGAAPFYAPWWSETEGFAVTNIEVVATKYIPFTDDYSMGVGLQLVYNPAINMFAGGVIISF